MVDEKVADAAQNEESVDTNKDSGSDELRTQINELKELNQHLKESLDYQKKEAKKAFDKRDAIKNELNSTKESERTKEDLAKYASDLETKLKEKENQINEITTRETTQRKLSALKDVAIKQGIKEIYLDRLDRFVDLEDVDPKKEVSLRLAVDTVKANYPDFFGVNSENVDRAIPSPKLAAGSGVGDYKEQYNKLLNTPPIERQPDHIDKLAELKQLLSE